MEERRLEGGRLVKAGKLSQAEIARQLGVSQTTVSDWAKVVESQGIKGLKSKKARGIEDLYLLDCLGQYLTYQNLQCKKKYLKVKI